MKKEVTISKLLGVPQQEMANLLGITRSHYSMFESGKRNLPLAATQLLRQLLTHMQPKPDGQVIAPIAERHAEYYKQIERLLRENEFQQNVAARKIDAALRKHQAQSNAAELAQFFNQPVGKSTQHTDLQRATASLLGKGPTSQSIATLVKLEIKQGLLVNEQKWLESQLLREDREVDKNVSE